MGDEAPPPTIEDEDDDDDEEEARDELDEEEAPGELLLSLLPPPQASPTPHSPSPAGLGIIIGIVASGSPLPADVPVTTEAMVALVETTAPSLTLDGIG